MGPGRRPLTAGAAPRPPRHRRPAPAPAAARRCTAPGGCSSGSVRRRRPPVPRTTGRASCRRGGPGPRARPGRAPAAARATPAARPTPCTCPWPCGQAMPPCRPWRVTPCTALQRLCAVGALPAAGRRGLPGVLLRIGRGQQQLHPGHAVEAVEFQRVEPHQRAGPRTGPPRCGRGWPAAAPPWRCGSADRGGCRHAWGLIVRGPAALRPAQAGGAGGTGPARVTAAAARRAAVRAGPAPPPRAPAAAAGRRCARALPPAPAGAAARRHAGAAAARPAPRRPHGPPPHPAAAARSGRARWPSSVACSAWISCSKRAVAAAQWRCRSKPRGRRTRVSSVCSDRMAATRNVRGAPSTAATRYQVPAFSTSPSGCTVRATRAFQLS
jgi:hypothetical protein